MQNKKIEQWSIYEVEFSGPSNGNPYMDIDVSATFQKEDRKVNVRGFYDGEGTYRLRFMPDETGVWTYITSSNTPELDGVEGSFECTSASKENHGPVRAKDRFHFTYEDGTPYAPFGTTMYAWIHSSEDIQEQSLATLAAAPFNKVRMCVMPKNYSYNADGPDVYPFEEKDGTFDFTRFEPAFFKKLDSHLHSLQEMGIEADLILFHPYDKGRWGFDRMEPETDDFYLRYIIARVSAFRNVWWSLANEYDFMREKSMADWDRLLLLTEAEDPYNHLRSIHNGTRMYDPSSLVLYDHTKPVITHVSLQHWDVELTQQLHQQFDKPLLFDECGYEGNLPQRWGNLSPQEMTRRFWELVTRGGYCTHGETYLDSNDVIWWAKGGKLHGESPERIAFLRSIIDEAPAELEPIVDKLGVPTIGKENQYYLYYFGIHRAAYKDFELPEGHSFKVDVIDTWGMTVQSLDGVYKGTCRIHLPGTEYQAIRIVKQT
ncbi:DUF5605 domain-containing protein [Aureibacillus halotolerans]|uniref:Uncharacterized protein DUF4038 n=1 Tax=Aureibacillus halotolerans TaxID=1508390 RepID=A0A4R6TQN6_9BACI|nr:DUF5605 domain-containing protein [Aureibacillus halotolerans]TDQ33764.1 uncharacterized protein DUF4038 [Aureibacillus halotolerans]